MQNGECNAKTRLLCVAGYVHTGIEILFTFYFIENMTDKDLLDSDYDGISQIHEHSYIVVSNILSSCMLKTLNLMVNNYILNLNLII